MGLWAINIRQGSILMYCGNIQLAIPFMQWEEVFDWSIVSTLYFVNDVFIN